MLEIERETNRAKGQGWYLPSPKLLNFYVICYFKLISLHLQLWKYQKKKNYKYFLISLPLSKRLKIPANVGTPLHSYACRSFFVVAHFVLSVNTIFQNFLIRSSVVLMAPSVWCFKAWKSPRRKPHGGSVIILKTDILWSE